MTKFFDYIFFKLLKNLQLNYETSGVPAEFDFSIFFEVALRDSHLNNMMAFLQSKGGDKGENHESSNQL